MTENALERFVARTQASWGPLDSQRVAEARTALSELASAAPSEPWLSALLSEAPAARELHRDARQGWVLQAHSEGTEVYRSPHDHGRSWVVYAVASGEILMSTYARIEGEHGVQLVKRDETRLCAGQAQLFLPGDIHDTRCLAGPALLLRFTERDLKQEDALGHLTRYVQRDGVWTVRS